MPDCCCSNSLWLGIYFERDFAFREVWERDGLSCSNRQHPLDGSPGASGDDWIDADDVLVLFERAPDISQRAPMRGERAFDCSREPRLSCW